MSPPRIVLVVSEFFENTREIIRLLAQSPRCRLNVLKGDMEAPQAAPFLAAADRVWFEGGGPLLWQLLERKAATWLSGAALRVGDAQLPRLLGSGLWRTVSDLVVCSTRAGELVRRTCPPPVGQAMLHVIQSQRRMEMLGQAQPNAALGRLMSILCSQAGELPNAVWLDIAAAAAACRGEVLVMGDCPEEFAEFLRTAAGCKVFSDAQQLPGGKADAVVLWRCLEPADAAEKLQAAAGLLKEGGNLAAVAAPAGSQALGQQALERLMRSSTALAGRPVRLNGNVVLAAGCAQAAPDATARVEQARSAPLVSAVLTAYNEHKTIGRALASLRAQTYPHLEILVVDDGSTDGTADVVAAHAADRRVRLIRKPNGGIPDARNAGIAQAKGQYIAWLDADDVAMPNRIAAQVDAVLANPAVDLVYSDALLFGHDGALVGRRRYGHLTDESLPAAIFKGLSGCCPIMQPSQMVRRSLYDRVGMFDLTWPRSEDYEFYARCAAKGGNTYCHIPWPLVAKFEDRSPQQTQALLPRTLESFHRLFRLLIEAFDQRLLCGQSHLELGESPALCIGRQLLSIAMLYQAPAGHAMLLEAEQYLQQALAGDDSHSRAVALAHLGSARRYAGDLQAAGRYLQLACDQAASPWQRALAAEGLQQLQRDGHIEALPGRLSEVSGGLQ